MMEAFTPGPWEVRSKLVWPLHIEANGELVALVGAEEFSLAASNAELIAAAPDLLHGCKIALQELYDLMHPYLTEEEFEANHAVKTLRDAIAKCSLPTYHRR